MRLEKEMVYDIRRILIEIFADSVGVFGSAEGQYLNDAAFYNKVNLAGIQIERLIEDRPHLFDGIEHG